MTFIRTRKGPGDPPDALDRFFGLFRDAMRATGRPAGAVAPQAAATIRHVSAATRAGAGVEAAAAHGLLSGPASGVLDLSPDEVEELIGSRTRELMEICTPSLWRASRREIEKRLLAAETTGDRDVAVLHLLAAEGAAAHVLWKDDGLDEDLRAKLEAVLRHTTWLGAVRERDELAGHLTALQEGPG